ncbi:MAG: DNA cytosine methyltransferase [Solirubrobacteraceae bacterium]|jgi:DNA (cytosine-5)-methyltransferase 1
MGKTNADRAPRRPADRVRGFTSVSLFTGAGGLDLGCEQAGFQSLAAVESNPIARQTLLANSGRWLPGIRPACLFSDMVELDHDALLDAAGLDVGEVDLVHGGPPCTPFSKSGYWLAYKRAGADPKASLLDSYVDALRAIKPKAFLMENVYGLAYNNHNRPVLERFMAGVRDAGYSLDSKILLAADYGVPQLRQRLVCVGIRHDLLDGDVGGWEFPWPRATHSGPHETRKGWDESLLPHASAGEALAGLRENPPEPEEVVSGTYAGDLRAVPAGDNYLCLTDRRGHPAPRFKWRSRYWSFLLKLHPDFPSPTIQGQPGPWVGPFHWESRRLRVAEVKRLMTFPDGYVVLGSRRDQQLQLGNAVPPKLGYVVADALADELVRLGAVGTLAAAA